jgi:pimeloyl-ACP methyl ester carboxylesterase
VLAIRGEQTNIFFADAAKRLNDIIADFELITIPNTGHFIPMEKPEPRHIDDFVKRKIAMAN